MTQLRQPPAATGTTAHRDGIGRFTRGLVSYRPGLFLANLCLWSLSHMAPLLPGYVTKVYYDGLAGDAPLVITPWSILALLAAIGVTRALVGVGAEWLWGGLWTRATGLVRLNLLRLIAAGPAALATPRSSSETVSRVRDDVEEGCLPLEEAIDGVGVVGFAVGAIAIMAAIDWLLTCIVTVPIVLSALAVQAVKTRVTALRRAARNAGADVAEFIGEVFGAFATFKLAPSIAGTTRRLERLNQRRRRAALREKVLAQVLEGVSDGTAVVCTSLLLFYLSFTGDRGFTVGEFVLFVTYLDQVADYAQWMMGMLVNVRRANVSLARLRSAMPAAAGAAAELTCRDAVAAAERLTEAGRAAPLQRLDLRGVTYLHPASGAGIRDIDLTLERGSFTVVTGRIGAGKTTLLKVLLGLLPRQAGELRWNGAAVAHPDRFMVPPRASYTPQTPKLFSTTVRDNISLGAPLADAALAAAVRDAVLEPDLAAMEAGLRTRVGARGLRLSGGQAQRVAAARMLAQGAQLLVIDDLSSALDVKTERLLWDRVLGRVRAARPTCLVVSHRRRVLRHADRIVLLSRGRVAAVGTLDALLAESAELRRIWDAGGAGPDGARR